MAISEKELQEKFGLSSKDVEALAAPWDAGELPGEPVGEVMVGRPLLFGVELKSVGFKETEEKIVAIDKRADSLGMKRSDYLRWLVDKDLASAAVV